MCTINIKCESTPTGPVAIVKAAAHQDERIQ